MQIRKLRRKRASVLFAVHFADDHGSFLSQQSPRSAEDFNFRSFHVALDEVRRRIRQCEIIERYRAYLNRVSAIRLYNMSESAIGRRLRINSREIH